MTSVCESHNCIIFSPKYMNVFILLFFFMISLAWYWKPLQLCLVSSSQDFFSFSPNPSCCTLSHVQLFVTLDYSPPGSSVHEISQARILKWVVISFSRGSSYPRDQTCDSWVFWMGGQILYHCTTWKAPISFISNRTKQVRTFHSSWVM